MKKFQKIDSELFSKNAIQPDQMRYVHGGAMSSTANSGAGGHTFSGTGSDGKASSVAVSWASDDSSTGEHTGTTSSSSSNDASGVLNPVNPIQGPPVQAPPASF